MPNSIKIKKLQAKHLALLEERKSVDADCKLLAKHFLPRKSRFLDGKDSDGTNKSMLRTDVLDGTGIRARRVASAGIHGGMTSPARPWFRLTLQDEDLAQHGSVRPWLDEVQKRMRNLFARSNFYQAIHSLYDEIITFGTNFMFEHPDLRMGLFFNSMTFGEYCIDTDHNGRVDTVFRTMKPTARNVVNQFGYENCSDSIKRAYDLPENQLSRFDIVHAIVPRADRDPGSLNNLNMPFASYYYEKDATTKFLRESGYSMIPGIGVRWDVTAQDSYGSCPTMDSLGDIRMLQSVWATYLKQEHKRADPPIVAPSKLSHPNTLPGGVNHVNTVGGSQALYAAYQVNPDPTGIQLIVQDVRNSIREGMYNDLFKMLISDPRRQPPSATEVVEKEGERLLLLGPVLERLHAEGFIPLIDRTFFLMLEQDQIPPWPEELDDIPLKVDFVSLLAQAQKVVATGSIDKYVGFIGDVSTVWPESVDIVDIDKVGNDYAEHLGLPDKMLRTQEERDAIREERNAAALRAQQAEDAAAGAQTAQTMADTPVNKGASTALDEVLKGASQ